MPRQDPLPLALIRPSLVLLGALSLLAAGCESGTECEVDVRFEGQRAAGSHYASEATQGANPGMDIELVAAQRACATICRTLHPSVDEPWTSEASRRQAAEERECRSRCREEGEREVECEEQTRRQMVSWQMT